MRHFYIIQFLTGLGCFGAFLYRIGRGNSSGYSFCTYHVGSAEHTFCVCQRWEETFEECFAEMGALMTDTTLTQWFGRTKLENSLKVGNLKNAMREAARKKNRTDRVRPALHHQDWSYATWPKFQSCCKKGSEVFLVESSHAPIV